MSVQKFAVGSSNTILAQPDDERIYFRSSDASDDGDLTLTGIIAGSADSETTMIVGKREIQSGIGDPFESLSAAIVSSAQTGVVSIYAWGIEASGRIIVSTQPSNNDNLRIGITGFLQTYVFKTTLTGAANEVKIGADVSATAANLSAAINAGAGAGTTYGTGTVANEFVIATVSASLLTITDKIACRRQLDWAISQSVGATIGIGLPTGGVDGTLLATIPAGITQAFNAFQLDSEDLVATTLPALLFPTTDALVVGGRPCTLRFKVANIGTAIPVIYQTSTDGTNWATGLTAITNLDNMSVAVPQFVHPSEANIEYIRLVFGSNANTTDSALDAAVIS